MTTKLLSTKTLITINGKEIVRHGIYMNSMSRALDQAKEEVMAEFKASLKPVPFNYEDDQEEDSYWDCHD